MIYVPKAARVIEARKLSADTVLLRVKTRMKHKPGQFVQISLLGLGECPVSICSYSRGFIDLCIRNAGMVTNALCKLRRGDAVFIRGPYGNGYPVKEIEGKELVIIGGGTGVASLKSVVEYFKKNKKRYRGINILLGFKCPEEILFRDDVAKWEAEAKTCLVSVDRAGKGWCGEVGVVTCLISRAKINKESAVMICGPPVMIRAVSEELERRGIPENNIYTSLERLMYCGVGKCGHCMVNGKFACRNGPVFRLDEIKKLQESGWER